MNCLLDTNAFLWIVSGSDGLSAKAKRAYLDTANNMWLSIASIWELAIKISLRRLEINAQLEKFIPEQLQANNIQQLNINIKHTALVAKLPFHHRDPFDRLLAAQALTENLAIISPDRAFTSYGVKRIW